MLAFLIFALTLFGILTRPFGLGVWVYSSLGALFVLAFELINFNDLAFIFWLIWDSSLTLIGLIVISLCLQSLGFFERLIFLVLRLCVSAKNHTNFNQNLLIINAKTLFIKLSILCALCASVLANDGAILIFTPLVLGLFLHAKKADFALIVVFLFGISFICDISSNALIISNLTNIIIANYHNIAFDDFAKIMFLPNLFGFVCGLVLFLLIFSKRFGQDLIFCHIRAPKLPNKLFIFHLMLLVCFVLSFFAGRNFGLPFCVNSMIFALILLCILWYKSPKKTINIIKSAPFSIIIFIFGLFIVVFALSKIEISNFIATFFNVILQDKLSAIFGTGFISALGAGVFNNLPMVLFGNLAINDFLLNSQNFDESTRQMLAYAHLLGANIGSKLTPIGSLCTLLWLGLLAKKRVKISYTKYFSYSLIFTVPVLFVALFALFIVLA